ncbi:unnamed protein product [Nezara viridula]|uniref:Uncharacterized protein n=1 Tax=Nezara viridula TaxID=85310 RepID=A0A9P0EAE3_NEZVI|nr:unnamed protein product [Nezara viridula]
MPSFPVRAKARRPGLARGQIRGRDELWNVLYQPLLSWPGLVSLIGLPANRVSLRGLTTGKWLAFVLSFFEMHPS